MPFPGGKRAIESLIPVPMPTTFVVGLFCQVSRGFAPMQRSLQETGRPIRWPQKQLRNLKLTKCILGEIENDALLW